MRKKCNKSKSPESIKMLQSFPKYAFRKTGGIKLARDDLAFLKTAPKL